MSRLIYTIGHSTHDLATFLNFLSSNHINCVIDVRSVPFSARVPQYNKEVLRQFLEGNDMVYMHFPKAFGARQTNPKLLDETGRVDFEKVRLSKPFKEGIEKLRYCIERGFKPTLMCSEGNPLDCHRFSMIAYHLVKQGFSVKHIMKDGEVLDNESVERLLLMKYGYKLTLKSLFDKSALTDTQLEFAYKLRNKDIGFLVSSNWSSEIKA